MKKLWKWIGLASACMLIPGVCTMLITGKIKEGRERMGIHVVMQNGEKIDGEQFVIGMAASELSYIKEEEALKAWMIVCRTNFKKAAGTNQEVKQEALSLDYVSMETLEENNGRKSYLELKNQLEGTSEETFGQVLNYGDACIDALYHQISIGKTVSSEEIYSVEVPYLMSVDSSQDVEASEYMDIKILSYKDCAGKLKEAGYKESASSCKNQLKISQQTENGFVVTVQTDQNKWTGEEWKEMFSLNSTNFYLEEYGGRLRIVTIGKGHDMGMSLYGANVLAKKGLSAKTILSYYYPGTEVKTQKQAKQ